MKNTLLILFILSFIACKEEDLFQENTRLGLWLQHNGADMPIVVEGNTNSKIFILLIHGGPGGSAQTFNGFLSPFSDLLEEDYAMVYWDQRNSGMSRGEWDESKITIEQHTEDLDQVIELLKFKFGNEIKIFLSGHSWGAYLSQAYLLDTNRQSKVKGWINMNGLNHRNQNIKDALNRMENIAIEQIALNNSVDDWNDLLTNVQIEANKNISVYDNESENIVFSLIRTAEDIILRDDLLSLNVASTFSSTYKHNVHPFLLSLNKRTLSILIPQMYDFDLFIDQNLVNIQLPSIFLYGIYDVRTSFAQAEYVMERISTDEEDKELKLFQLSGHSSPANEPDGLVEEIKIFIEKYK